MTLALKQAFFSAAWQFSQRDRHSISSLNHHHSISPLDITDIATIEAKPRVIIENRNEFIELAPWFIQENA